MEPIDTTSAALNHYFKVLECTGYYDKNDMHKLLIYMFIVDAILEGPFQQYLEDEHLAAINKALGCLGKNNCLIPRPRNTDRRMPVRQNNLYSKLRVTEYTKLRGTEDELPRTVEQDYMKSNL